MPVLGFRDQWVMSCSLNLASCRLRAEALARQLHSNLWSPRSSQGSPSDSGSVSPCFGLPSNSLVVIDRPPPKLDAHLRMSSLDDDEEMLPRTDGSDENGGVMNPSPPVQISPPYSPIETLELLPKNGAGLYGTCKEGTPWRPESPPESVDTEEPSAETISDLPSPTFELMEEGSPLADELRTRLSLIQSSQSEDDDEITVTSTLEEEETSNSSNLLSPPDACPRLVRSTSLKTGKTPPGTPSRKKIVRFADVLGLDLEAIRHFAKDDDVPVVPQSAFADLKLSPLQPWSPSPGYKLEPQFEQPASDIRFLDRVRQQKVSLENAMIDDLRLTALVRVLNLGFEKKVTVRYTTTEWASFADMTADYVPSSCDGFSDKFTFTLHLPLLSPGQRLLFAIRYIANGQEFWDNNNGNNYVLRCRPKSPEQDTVNGPRWLHHFM